MQALVLNDIFGQTERLRQALSEGRAAGAGAIFVLGNLLAPREHNCAPATAPDYTRLLDLLGSLHLPVYLVPGEHDGPPPALRQAIQRYGGPAEMNFVHRRAAYLGAGDVVAGFGGRLVNEPENAQQQWRLPSWEARVAFEHLASFSALFKLAPRRLLLFATPPQGSHIDRDEGSVATGSSVLNTVIRIHQPHLVCCGGPSCARGVETIDGACVVNPGALADGSFAIVDLERIKAELHWLHEPLPRGVGAMHNVLVAIDGSPESWRALEIAAGMVRGGGGELTLLHAFEPISAALGSPYTGAVVGKRYLEGEHLLEAAADYVADLQPRLELLEGPAPDAIVRVAKTRHVDLIVMGARGRTGLRVLLGSVSRKVLRAAPCAVLVTREQPTVPALSESHPEPAL